MKRAGVDVALHPRDWGASAGGRTTIGTRSAAWAPITELDAVLVLDEQDQAYQSEAAPTWHARDVVLERAKRDGARWVIASPAPSLEALTCGAPLLTADRATERAGWPIVDLVDLRDEPPFCRFVVLTASISNIEHWSPSRMRFKPKGTSPVCLLRTMR